MTVLMRVLTAIGALELLVIAAIYLPLSRWRLRGRVGWFLAGLIVSLGYISVISVAGWWLDLPRWVWLPGVILFDISLALQLSLLLRRRIREDPRE